MDFRVIQEKNNTFTIKNKNEIIIDNLTKEEVDAFRKIYRAIRIAEIRNK